MKNNSYRKKLTVCILLILVFLLFFGMLCSLYSFREQFSPLSNSRKHSVAVITKSGTSAFWQSVFSGVRAAATEYNLDVTIRYPDNEEDYETQNQMIREAVRQKAEVIVFSSVDYEANAAAVDEAAKAGVRVVVFDSDVNSSLVSSRIGTDNHEAGKTAARAALSSGDPSLKIGIINFDKNSANGQEREEGFREEILRYDHAEIIASINVLSTTEDAKKGTIEMLQAHPEINVLVTFNEWTSLGVGYAIQELKLAKETTVVAFDSNVISVGMLETGEVDALIVQNPFAMGYLGIEHAYKLIFDREPPARQVDTSTTLITRDNMYEEECQRVLFPFD